MSEMEKELVVFKALADPIRLNLLGVINTKDKMCVCELVERFDISQSKLSYHLKMLLEAELLLLYPQGKWNFYSVNRETMKVVLAQEMIDKIFKKTA